MTEKPKRRKLHFDTLDDALAETERLAEGEVETTGRYSYGQILDHMAKVTDTVTGELVLPPAPLPLRIAIRMARPIMIRNTLPAGFKLPSKTQSVLWSSEDVDVATGLQRWKEAIDRYKNGELQPHPVFGKMTREQHDQIQCRHAELHLSFVHPLK